LYYGCGTRVRRPSYIHPNNVKKEEKQKKTVVKTKEKRIRTFQNVISNLRKQDVLLKKRQFLTKEMVVQN
jgi:hypothetical protein